MEARSESCKVAGFENGRVLRIKKSRLPLATRKGKLNRFSLIDSQKKHNPANNLILASEIHEGLLTTELEDNNLDSILRQCTLIKSHR